MKKVSTAAPQKIENCLTSPTLSETQFIDS